MSALNDEEKSRVRHHLGYLGVGAAQTFVSGYPAAVQTQFMIEGAMDRLLPESLSGVRRILGILDGIESQMVDDLELLAIKQIDTIEVNQEEQSKLLDMYDHWRKGLANFFGVIPNPFDQRFSSGGINARVVG